MTEARIFLCYARADKEKVEIIYNKLKNEGFHPWMDTEDILPGERWESRIRQTIRASDFFLACLTHNSTDRRGQIQKEINEGLAILGEKLDDDIFVIPTRLEKCEVPAKLREYQWVDLYLENGWDRLMQSFRTQMDRMKNSLPVKPKNVFLAAPKLPGDRKTEITVQWAAQFLQSLRGLENVQVTSFLGRDAIRENVESALKEDFGNSGVFAFIDNGDSNSLNGSDEMSIIDRDNIELLRNKFVYAVSEKSAQGLGHEYLRLEDGVAGYIGFLGNYHITPYAPETVGRCFLSGLNAILKENRSAIEARTRIDSETNSIISQLEKLYSTTGDSRMNSIIATLSLNMESMVCLGNPNWRLR